ncbi:MAG: helix-turn-helix domain-containing protein [Methanocorpusculum sp.]|nr:helix-turn-helix domain-containing protein [Methanocorpusculum sp.]
MDQTAVTENKPKYMTGIDAAVSIISGKWKTLILYQLEDGTLRYSQILNGMRYGITQRMLTKELRELEETGLISRTVYPEVPPRVEYSLTAKGRSLMPILDQLCTWGCRNMADQLEHNCDAECEEQTE